MVFIDNFFTNMKLLTALKNLNIGKYKIIEASYRFVLELLEIHELSINKND